jgi:hypothetical protein
MLWNVGRVGITGGVERDCQLSSTFRFWRESADPVFLEDNPVSRSNNRAKMYSRGDALLARDAG